MKAHLPLAASLLLAACAGGGRPVTATTYGPANLLGGYSDRQVEPGVWRVRGNGNGVAGPGFGRNMALYRAAEIAEGQGFGYFQVLDQKGSTRMRGPVGRPTDFVGESLSLTIRGVADPAAPLACRAKQPAACATLNVAEIKARIEPQLTFRNR